MTVRRASGCGKTLNVTSDEDAEAPEAADHAVMQQEPGRVLDDLAAAADQPAFAVDDPHADEKVAHAAVAIAPWSAEPAGDRAANGGAVRTQNGGSNGRYWPCAATPL